MWSSSESARRQGETPPYSVLQQDTSPKGDKVHLLREGIPCHKTKDTGFSDLLDWAGIQDWDRPPIIGMAE